MDLKDAKSTVKNLVVNNAVDDILSCQIKLLVEPGAEVPGLSEMEMAAVDALLSQSEALHEDEGDKSTFKLGLKRHFDSASFKFTSLGKTTVVLGDFKSVEVKLTQGELKLQLVLTFKTKNINDVSALAVLVGHEVKLTTSAAQLTLFDKKAEAAS